MTQQPSASKSDPKSTSNQAADPWYRDGLPFGCTGCGDCCTGDPGYVWVDKAEVETLAAAAGLTVPEFQRKYTRLVGIRRSLVEYPNGDCALLGKDRKCTLYEARPRQCRTWPFWASNLTSPERWKEVCQACPGAGTGPLIPLEEIEKSLSRVRV